MATPDITRNSFNEDKRYTKVIWQKGKPLSDSDFNEAQDLLKFDLYRLINNFLGKGVTDTNDFKVIPSLNTNSVKISCPIPCYMLAKGFVLRYVDGDIEVPLDASPIDDTIEYIYLKVEDKYIDSTDDASILNFAVETAIRRKLEVTGYWSITTPTDTTYVRYIRLAKVTRNAMTEVGDIIQVSQIVDMRSILSTLEDLKDVLSDMATDAANLSTHIADVNGHHTKIHTHQSSAEQGLIPVTIDQIIKMGRMLNVDLNFGGGLYSLGIEAIEYIKDTQYIGLVEQNSLGQLYYYAHSPTTTDFDKTLIDSSGSGIYLYNRISLCGRSGKAMIVYIKGGNVYGSLRNADGTTVVAPTLLLGGSVFTKARVTYDGAGVYYVIASNSSNQIKLYAFTVSGGAFVDYGGTSPTSSSLVYSGTSSLVEWFIKCDEVSKQFWIVFQTDLEVYLKRGIANISSISYTDTSPILLYSTALAIDNVNKHRNSILRIDYGTNKKFVGLTDDTTYDRGVSILNITDPNDIKNIKLECTLHKYRSTDMSFDVINDSLIGQYQAFEATPDICDLILFSCKVTESGFTAPSIVYFNDDVTTLNLVNHILACNYTNSYSQAATKGLILSVYQRDDVLSSYRVHRFRYDSLEGNNLDLLTFVNSLNNINRTGLIAGAII